MTTRVGKLAVVAIVAGAACFAWWRGDTPHVQTAPQPEALAPSRAADRPVASAHDSGSALSSSPVSATSAAIKSPPVITAAQALRDVRGLVDQQKIGAARALAEHYLAEIPDGPEASQIKSLTGVHPHP